MRNIRSVHEACERGGTHRSSFSQKYSPGYWKSPCTECIIFYSILNVYSVQCPMLESMPKIACLRFIQTILLVGGMSLLLGCAGGPMMLSEDDLAFDTLSGDPVDTGRLTGKIVILDFWATWCGPCKETMPDVQALHERYANDDRVEVLSVNVASPEDVETPNRVVQYWAREGYTVPMAYDRAGMSKSVYDIRIIPTLLVVDPSGQVQERIVGASVSVEKRVPKIVDRLKAQPSTETSATKDVSSSASRPSSAGSDASP